MKKLFALAAVTGLIAVGCASHDKGGTYDESYSTTTTQESGTTSSHVGSGTDSMNTPSGLTNSAVEGGPSTMAAPTIDGSTNSFMSGTNVTDTTKGDSDTGAATSPQGTESGTDSSAQDVNPDETSGSSTNLNQELKGQK